MMISWNIKKNPRGNRKSKKKKIEQQEKELKEQRKIIDRLLIAVLFKGK